MRPFFNAKADRKHKKKKFCEMEKTVDVGKESVIMTRLLLFLINLV